MPKETIRVLNALAEYGLTDEQFRIVHHRTGSAISIGAHLKYCDKISNFVGDDSTNARVRRRLEHMLLALRASGSSRPAPPGVLKGFARAAVKAIPKQ